MRRGKRVVITCHLCSRVWTAPAGNHGSESYREHYMDEHYVELEDELVMR